MSNIIINGVTYNNVDSITVNNTNGGTTKYTKGDKPDQQKTVNPTTTQQSVVADSGYELTEVIVNAVTSDIDENIKPENIKEGVAILGVAGTIQQITGSPKFAELVDGSISNLESEDLTDIITIRDKAFIGAINLTSAVIPSNVATIGDNAFSGCINLQTVILANGIQTIGVSAFEDTAISVLNIPSSVQSIGANAFAGTNITEIDMSNHPIPPSVTSTTFPSSLTTIKVAYRDYETYLSAWADYADKIVRLPAIPSTITVITNNYLGELVSGAVVTIEGNGQVYTGTTDSLGVFVQGDLQPATYTISVADVEGFKTPETSEVVVEEDTQNSVTVTYLEKPALLPFEDADLDYILNVGEQIVSNNMTSEDIFLVFGWKAGDSKIVTNDSGAEVAIQIMGFNHDVQENGTKTAFTFRRKNIAVTQRFYSSYTNGDNYFYSQVAPVANDISYLPSDWQNVVKSVQKTVCINAWTSSIETKTVKGFIPSLAEIKKPSVIGSPYVNEGTQYEYWKDETSTSLVGGSESFIMTNASGKAVDWWTRTKPEQKDGDFFGIRDNGKIMYGDLTQYYGVCQMFCV